MENRIKEQQLALFADRTSTQALRSNQLRLYFSSFTYVLIETLRALGLGGASWPRAQYATIRLKLLKVGAQIRITACNPWIWLSQKLIPMRASSKRCWPECSRSPCAVSHSDWPVPSLVPGIRRGQRITWLEITECLKPPALIDRNLHKLLYLSCWHLDRSVNSSGLLF